MHKKKLAHLDIKPANILIAFCEPEDVAASPAAPSLGLRKLLRLSPDSGAGALLELSNHMFMMIFYCSIAR